MRRPPVRAAVMLALLLVTGGVDAHRRRGASPMPATIGVATQEADGTIVLQLRLDQDGLIGDGLVRYPPGDPNYPVVARHVGPIPKGGSVFVRPFPDVPKARR